jgi:hypothetical protein
LETSAGWQNDCERHFLFPLGRARIRSRRRPPSHPFRRMARIRTVRLSLGASGFNCGFEGSGSALSQSASPSRGGPL